MEQYDLSNRISQSTRVLEAETHGRMAGLGDTGMFLF